MQKWSLRRPDGLAWKAPMRRSMGSPRLTKREQRCRLFLITANSSEADRSTFVWAASSMGFQLSSLIRVSRVSLRPFSSASMYTLHQGHRHQHDLWMHACPFKVYPSQAKQKPWQSR